MKVVSITILRNGEEMAEALPLVQANDLTSYGFFQRQVSFFRRMSFASHSQQQSSVMVMSSGASRGNRRRLR
jgi:hypothetical protein